MSEFKDSLEKLFDNIEAKCEKIMLGVEDFLNEIGNFCFDDDEDD